MSEPAITVKFLARGHKRCADEAIWLRQFPRQDPVWGRCRFLFDRASREYDWLVVYDDLPRRDETGISIDREPLACPQLHTLLITTEPSSIRTYNRAFVQQFGHVLSSQEPRFINHRHHIHMQCGLRWFYGRGDRRLRTYDEMAAHPPLEKSALISTVCSAKRQRHTLHRRRYEFTAQLKSLLPELDVFGRGVRAMDDKADALDVYRYHVAVENHLAAHHWTEKLADAFLGCTLPFYHGCPNAAEYFPAESFIPIDISNPREAAAIISDAMHSDQYTQRLPHILEARRRVLEEHNLFAVLSRLIEERHWLDASATRVHRNDRSDAIGVIYSAAAMRRRSPISAVSDLVAKLGRTLARR